MIEALVFDMDGTIVDSEPLHYRAWHDVLVKYGVAEFSYGRFTDYIGASNEKLAQDYCDQGYIQVGATQLIKEKQKLYLELIPDISLISGMARALALFQTHYRLAVASSSEVLELAKILKVHGLSGAFEQVIGGDMVARKKPEPDIYLQTARALGLAPAKCLAFEDSESGVVAASRAGMRVVAIPNELSDGHDFSQADLVVETIADVSLSTIAHLGLPDDTCTS